MNKLPTKKFLMIAGILLLLARGVSGQNFLSYYQDGLYKFEDGTKIQKSQIFSANNAWNFGYTQGNSMVLDEEGQIDEEHVSGRYHQTYMGYKVENTMVNVISKYGVVLCVNGFSLPYLDNVDVMGPILSQPTALTAALNYVNADRYAWEDQDLEASIKQIITYQSDTVGGDTTYDLNKTYYPKGELVITLPYGDTNIYDTSKYALCWKFAINPMYYEQFNVDTNTVDTIAHYMTHTGYRLHNEVIVYVNAKTGAIHSYNPNYNQWTAHINPTCHDGNQDVDVQYAGSLWWLGTWMVKLHDVGRNITQRKVIGSGGSTYEQDETSTTDTWGHDTWKSAYWQIQKSSDYFRYRHGFWGTQQPPTAYAITQTIWKNKYVPGGGRVATSYNSTTNRDEYFVGEELSGGTLPHSTAFLDVMAHEYTHSILRHGPNFNSYGQAGALAEGLCDFFGTWCAYYYLPGGYTSNWGDGHGRRTNEYGRRFSDPWNDYLAPSAGAYGDANWSTWDIWRNGGVLRHHMVLHDWGGSYNGINVAAVPPTERDYFVTMMWWSWSNMGYHDFRNQMLAWYDVKYGNCSEKWKSCVRAWAAVNVGSIPDCARFKPSGPRVIKVNTGVTASNSTFSIRATTINHPPVISYDWDFPQDWNVTYLSQQDHSEFTLNTLQSMQSAIVKCVIGLADSTYDTVSTYVHFVDEQNYEQRTIPSTPKHITEHQTEAIEIFPNPTKGIVNVYLQAAPKSAYEFRMFDMAGREICKRTIIDERTAVTLPPAAPGIYIVRIKGDGKEFVKRLTIE